MLLKINTNKIKILHSSVIEYCQNIEYDLKWLIGESCGVDVEDAIFLELDSKKCSLGKIINIIEQSELIPKANLFFLKQMNKKRNFYCHKCFIKFYAYKTNINQYIKLLNLLTNDLEKFKNLYKDISILRYQNN